MIRNPPPTQSGFTTGQAEPLATFTDALDRAATGSTGLNFYDGRGRLIDVLSYTALGEQARRMAAGLISDGLERGDCVALLAETSVDFVRAFCACQYAGLVPVPLPLPAPFSEQDAYANRVQGLLAATSPRAVYASKEGLDAVRRGAAGTPAVRVGIFDEIPSLDAEPPAHPAPGDISYLQFSSGTTRTPAGVAITHRALMANTYAIARDGLRVGPGDRCVSWLPFYHDMGLVGFLLTAITAGLSVDYLATGDFARRPLQWLRLISANRATIAYSPSFGYGLCARRASPEAAGELDLSCWRAAGIGGDMIRPGVLDDFASTFEAAGFRRSSFVPSYGMAETTLALTFAPAGRLPRLDRVDLASLEDDGVARPAHADTTGVSADAFRAREFVSCGTVLPGHEIEIRDAGGVVRGEREVGRIFARGPSLMSHYVGEGAAKEAALGPDGWLDTGDLGYILRDELFVTGRAKDLIIVHGRNIWPQDLEAAAQAASPAIRDGEVAAFSLDDGDGTSERVVVLVGCRARDTAGTNDVAERVVHAIRGAHGLDCEVVLVPPRSLPRTSSGKLSRGLARTMLLGGAFAEPAPQADAKPATVTLDGAR